MKMNIDLTDKLLRSQNKHKPRVLHRYSCSEIYGLLKGWTTPEQWLKGEEKDFINALRVFNGTWKHKQIQSLLPEYEQEVKKELEVGTGITKGKHILTLVGMADLLTKDEVIEIKTSEKVHDKAKEWHLSQARLYSIIFNRPCVIVQPIVAGDKLLLKEIGRVKPNPNWFQGIMEKLKEKDDEIIKVNEKLQILKEDSIAEEWKEREADQEPERQAERGFEEKVERETNDIKEDLL